MTLTASQVKLTEACQRDIFVSEILPRFRSEELGAPLPAKREAVILGGQPGAGKTGLLEQAQQELGQRGATWVINGDDFYAYHPKYAQLQKEHGTEAPRMVKDDARAWATMTFDAARERGVNIVLESTMRQPDAVLDQLKELRQSGYAVQARVLAVKEQESWQGNHARHELIAAQGGYPRLTSKATHDAAVPGVVKTVAAIESKKLAERVTVHRRNGSVIHDSTRHKTPAAEAITKERSVPFSAERIAKHTANWNAIEDMALKRHQREAVTPKRGVQELTAIRTQRHADELTLNAERDRAAQQVTKKAPERGRDR